MYVFGFVVVSGTLSSSATFLNTAAGSISFLSGDAAYMRKRDVKRLKRRAARGGGLSGLKHGGESVVSGVASGEGVVYLHISFVYCTCSMFIYCQVAAHH